MTHLPPPTLPPPTGAPITSNRLVLEPSRPPHPTLPVEAAAGAIIVLVVSLFTSKYVLDALVGFEWPVIVYVALLGMVGYGPPILWCRFASRRWGSGSFRTDVGLNLRPSDLGWGPVVWLAAVGTQVVIGAVLIAFDVPLANNTEGISELTEDRTYVVSLFVTAVIAAPVVEEIVFRGVVMRGLRSRLAAVPAVAAQAVLFGVAHVDPVRGVGNVGLALVLTGVGAAFGGAAYLLRRIGPTIIAHAIFNGVVLVLVLTRVVERLQN